VYQNRHQYRIVFGQGKSEQDKLMKGLLLITSGVTFAVFSIQPAMLAASELSSEASHPSLSANRSSELYADKGLSFETKQVCDIVNDPSSCDDG
jgi:hypothetical protein